MPFSQTARSASISSIGQPSAEALLIGALLNNRWVGEAKLFGITPTHFIGHRDAYNWLLQYVADYGSEPSWEIFKATFPSFPKTEHSDVRSACDMVFKAYGKAQITTAVSDAMQALQFGEVTEAESILKSVTVRRATPRPKRVLTDRSFLDNWEEENRRIETPYRTLNRMTGGIRPGNLWYLAARPGNGKSAHLVDIATRAVLDNCRVRFFSLEMSELEVKFRFHAALANHFGYMGKKNPIVLDALRDRRLTSQEYHLFLEFLEEKLKDRGTLDVHTPREGMVTPSLVGERADEYHLNIVDYIGLMRADDGTRAVNDWRVAAALSNALKETALSSSSGFLAASQINREGDSGRDAPKLSQLSQSDALGQDGDVVLTLRNKSKVTTHFSIEKNRHGGTAQFHTTFYPNTGEFTEITADQAEDLALMQEASA
jgi:replicative DNA helicase